MAEFPALPLWTDAWVADTHHLTRLSRGTYHDLLVLIWRTAGCRVPNSDEWLGARLHMTADEVRDELRPLIREFCKCDGNWITQKRLTREFRFVRKQRELQSVRAKARWNKEKDVCRGSTTSGIAPTPTPTPTPLIKESILSETGVSDAGAVKPVRKRTAYPEPFLAFWAQYPTDPIMSKKAAFAQWQRLDDADRDAACASLPAFRDHCRKNPTYRPVHAERYLSQRRFDGFEKLVVDPDELARAKDRADQLLKRGKYAVKYD